MATKVLHSRQEFEDACAIFDFSDKDCPYKQNQIAFDRFTAERGVPAFRIDPTLAGVHVGRNRGFYQAYIQDNMVQEIETSNPGKLMDVIIALARRR